MCTVMAVRAIPPKIQKPVSWIWIVMIAIALIVAVGRVFFK
jgi:hypothetical protein